MKPRKPLKRTGLKPPTAEQIARYQAKPRRAIPRGRRPVRVGRRGRREQQAWQVGRAAVVERSGGFCEGPLRLLAHPPWKHSADHVHHLLSRGRGGGHDPENLLHVCSHLHVWIHDHPAAAEYEGLLRSARSG